MKYKKSTLSQIVQEFTIFLWSETVLYNHIHDRQSFDIGQPPIITRSNSLPDLLPIPDSGTLDYKSFKDF